MADDQDTSAFANDESNAAQLLQGLISPAPAQSLVAPPPDTPPPTRPGQSTPVTGSLATPPSQATPKVSPAPEGAKATLSGLGPAPAYNAARAAQLQQARSSDAIPIDPNQAQYQPSLGTKIRPGLAGYFSGGIGGAIGADYSAPNARYSVDEAAQQGRLAQDDANLANLNKSYDESAKGYQQSLDQARNAILLQRNDQLQQARQQNAKILQQLADARQEAADTQRQLAEAKVGNARQQSSPAQPAASLPDRSSDPNYVKVVSNGQIGYLPKANLAKAQQRDKNLRILK
jgi:hypothetical protein